MNDELLSTIQSSIRECDVHVSRMERAAEILMPIFPLSKVTLTELQDDMMARIDQFVYRFTKLQDSMARRLLASLYGWLESDDEPKPFLDILHRLERLEVISDISLWQRFRNLRNSLAHDYPESQDQTVATLNELFATWNELAAMYLQARDYFLSRT